MVHGSSICGFLVSLLRIPLSEGLVNPGLFLSIGDNLKFSMPLRSAERDIGSLNDWALKNGVELKFGLELKQEDESKEWGVFMAKPLDEPKPHMNDKSDGSAQIQIMLIPPKVVISSATVDPILKHNIQEQLSYVGKGMRQYLPELCLFVRLLEEYKKKEDSSWYPWIRSLPTTFSTGLFMDEFERSYARQIGMGIFLDHQAEQWETFRTIYRKLVLPQKNSDDNLLLWAFSIVFTRSWTTSYKLENGESAAVLVPLGDMFNHNSAKRNVLVVQETADSNVTLLFQTKDKNNNNTCDREALYLSYGFTEWPARFIFTFGFLDTSSSAVFSNITFDTTVDTNARAMGFTDASNLVFYTDDGAISDRAWLAVLYKVLLQKQRQHPHDKSPMEKQKILLESCTNLEDPLADNRLVQCYLQHQKECVAWMLLHIESMLNTIYGPVPEFSKLEYEEHSRLEMLHRYHFYMRELHLKVRDNLPV